jgi:hypothetical protein
MSQVVQLWILNCSNCWIGFPWLKKMLLYVKHERFNLQTCAFALTSIVSCSNLVLLEPFDGLCLGYALSKVCRYVTSNDKMFTSLPYTFINVVQGAIQKCITWPKFFGKGKQTWGKACIKFRLKLTKLNIFMKTR